jgi:hypothetical protein
MRASDTSIWSGNDDDTRGSDLYEAVAGRLGAPFDGPDTATP